MVQAFGFFPFQVGRRYKISQLTIYASFLYAPVLKGSNFSSLPSQTRAALLAIEEIKQGRENNSKNFVLNEFAAR